MKGIYITEEGERELEAMIAEIEKEHFDESSPDRKLFLGAELRTYKHILLTATILPVEESWGKVPMGTNECELTLPNGVIIQPKQ